MTDWRDFYRDIILSPEEMEEAILEGQKKKYFRERAKENDGTMQAKNSSTDSPKVADKDKTNS